jgi:hypothetical protein
MCSSSLLGMDAFPMCRRTPATSLLQSVQAEDAHRSAWVVAAAAALLIWLGAAASLVQTRCVLIELRVQFYKAQGQGGDGAAQ